MFICFLKTKLVYLRCKQMREDYYAGLEDRYFLTFDQAKEQKLKIDFDANPPAPPPNKPGITLIDQVSLQDVVPYIDWVRFCFLILCHIASILFNNYNS